MDKIYESFVRSMLRMRRSSYSMKKRAKRMEVYHKCARWTYDKHCKSKRMILVNQEEKIHFIKDELSKKSLYEIIQVLDIHFSGNVRHISLNLVKLLNKEKEHYSLKNLMLKNSVYQCIRKLDGK